MTEHVNTIDCEDIAGSARTLLARQVDTYLKDWNGFFVADRMIRRVEVSLPPMDPFCWLRAQTLPTKIYWSSRGEKSYTVAVGEADSCTCPPRGDFAYLRRYLTPIFASCDPSIRYYGGLRFDQTMESEDVWDSFGAYKFVLPRFEVRCSSDGVVLVCNLVLPRDRKNVDALLFQIDKIAFPQDGMAPVLQAPVMRTVLPEKNAWDGMVGWALDSFGTSRLDKVVLARKASFTFAEPPCPITLLRHLKAGTPQCFHFCFQWDGAGAFVGASPERLFRRCGREIESEAVAGTRPRGNSETDDARLRDELLHSDKERREHEYVRISMQEEMTPLSESVCLDAEPSEMKLANRRHLVSRMRATLRKGVTTLDVLAALHPTPAVGGYPYSDAMDAIRNQEPFDRGWYAGPVGWIGPDAAEFAVGIRSGLVHDNTLSLYSGAGIVEGSEPTSEWSEIEHKIMDFTKVLGLDSHL